MLFNKNKRIKMEGKSLHKNYQDKPDIVSVLRKKGIQVKPTGKYWRAFYPLHCEKKPHSMLTPKRQTFCLILKD
jgi:hypothetical protein